MDFVFKFIKFGIVGGTGIIVDFSITWICKEKLQLNKYISNSYISPQINRAEKNKSYFYNCYGKEEKFYIENQG